jgi:hypothetical protein
MFRGVLANYRERRAAAQELALAQETFAEASRAPGANDPKIYQHRKILGMFMVEGARLRFDYADPATGVAWQAGDPYLDVTVPPLGRKSMSLEAISASHRLLAEYVAYNGLHAYTDLRAVGSLTNHRFAAIAERFLGFQTAQVPAEVLPQDYVVNSRGLYERFIQKGGAPYEPAFIYQSPDQLLQRYPDLAPIVSDPLPRNYDIISELELPK